MSSTPSQRCLRPGCTGTIEDGYCSECGLAPLAGTPTGFAERGVTGSTRTGSRALPSTISTTAGVSGRTPSSRNAWSTRSTRSGAVRSSRRLGGGHIVLSPLPARDPLATLVPGVVPERKRFCSQCGAKLTRDRGFCAKCGQEYSFIPTLQPGDIVLGKYEIKGTMAFGGLGWIYLAFDTVLARWVVLKGLLNTRDPALAALAVKEREFLAAVKHPAIVGIYDFIMHGSEGFIVMEYVNGKNLLTLRREHGGPLPPREAIAYILDILPAFGYLDGAGLVYCDFKPENAMIEEDTVKLVDLGAVRRADDTGGDIFGSKGYTAPEAGDDPTAVSDLYSVARALAVLAADFDFQGCYEYDLPPVDGVAVFAQHESLYRFLVKATRHAPDDRFQTADEMAAQLAGVLRDVVAGTEDFIPLESTLFFPDAGPEEGRGRGDTLPGLKLDPLDPGTPAILATGDLADLSRRYEALERALVARPASVELPRRMVDTLIAAGRLDEAATLLDRHERADPHDWRAVWQRGRIALAQGRPAEAAGLFETVLNEVPGESAPKLALATAWEQVGDLDRAIRLYDLVASADPAMTSAAFGLARCYERRGDRDRAADAYTRVPGSSSRYASAQAGLARALLVAVPAPPGEPELLRAATAVEGLRAENDGLELRQIAAQVLSTAAELIEAQTIQADRARRILGEPLIAEALRLGAERELRACARFAAAREDKIRFVDEANRVRPRTLV